MLRRLTRGIDFGNLHRRIEPGEETLDRRTPLPLLADDFDQQAVALFLLSFALKP